MKKNSGRSGLDRQARPSIRSAVSSPTRTTGGELHLANYMDATNKLLKPIEGVGQYVIDAVAKVGDFSIFLVLFSLGRFGLLTDSASLCFNWSKSA
jgi:hypothetical protein